jgi:hypothetical protein
MTAINSSKPVMYNVGVQRLYLWGGMKEKTIITTNAKTSLNAWRSIMPELSFEAL